MSPSSRSACSPGLAAALALVLAVLPEDGLAQVGDVKGVHDPCIGDFSCLPGCLLVIYQRFLLHSLA